MPYPSIVKHRKDEVLHLRAKGLTIWEIADKFGVTESSIRRITGCTGRIREGHARPISERFWEKVKIQEGCWEWIGAYGTSGYGHIIWNRRFIDAHRMSYILANGTIPFNLLVLHKCNNKRCVNPEHLKLGTYHDNMIDFQVVRKEGEPSVSIRPAK